MIRRNFMKQSSLLASGLLLQSQLVNAFSLENEILNVAVIGCGDRGKGLLDILNVLPDLFRVTAICDVLNLRLEESKKFISHSSYKVFKDYQLLLQDKTIDVVIVATPLYLHFDVAVAVLDSGKHLYLEKTMTYNIAEVLALVKKSKQYPKQVLQVGHQYRYTPMCFKVKEMVISGYLGDVTQIDCRWDRNGSWRRTVPSGLTDRQINWRMYKEYSGGLVAELLSHQFDFINWVFNTHPDQIFATGGIDHYTDGRETYDNVQVMMRYKNAGMIGNFGATCGNAKDGYLFRLKGTKGTVEMLMDNALYFPEEATKKELQTVDGVTGATKLEWNKEGGIQIMNEQMKDGTWYALKDLHKCIVEKKQPSSNVNTGATTAVCVHLANQAMYDNTIQDWKNDYNFG